MKKRKIKWKRVIIAITLLYFLTTVFKNYLIKGQALKRVILDEEIALINEYPKNEEMPLKEPENNEIEGIKYRLTSYYTGDNTNSGSYVGAGIHTREFKINSKGWYTYKGKLVLAGATEELLRSGYSVKGGNVRQEGKHYFRYYDTVKLEIDGIIYDGIIIDSCGASMWYGETRLDLFVSNKASAVDRGYKGRNMVNVWY